MIISQLIQRPIIFQRYGNSNQIWLQASPFAPTLVLFVCTAAATELVATNNRGSYIQKNFHHDHFAAASDTMNNACFGIADILNYWEVLMSSVVRCQHKYLHGKSE